MVLELDFQDMGIDLEGIMEQRTWRWFRIRVLRILGDRRTRLHRVLAEKVKDDVQAT